MIKLIELMREVLVEKMSFKQLLSRIPASINCMPGLVGIVIIGMINGKVALARITLENRILSSDINFA